jgi:hypothetical protein
MRSSIYHPEGEVDPRGALAEYPRFKGQQGQTQMLTYWEEQTGKPSRQQRWYQWMHNQVCLPASMQPHSMFPPDLSFSFARHTATWLST